jgi:quercetin dioxygenase-like cupin family protein
MPRPSASAEPREHAPPILLRPEDLPVKNRGGGIVTTPLVTSGRGSRAMLTGITRIDPGCAVPLHYHNCEECVVVLTGHGFARIAGEDRPVRPRDTTWIPAGVHHCFINGSDGEPMEIFWTYASIDADRTIVATGVTTRIDAEGSS